MNTIFVIFASILLLLTATIAVSASSSKPFYINLQLNDKYDNRHHRQGDVVSLNLTIDSPYCNDQLLKTATIWPFLNDTQFGAPISSFEFDKHWPSFTSSSLSSSKPCSFSWLMLPLPEVGQLSIFVTLLNNSDFPSAGSLPVGESLPSQGVVAISHPVTIQVSINRDIKKSHPHPGRHKVIYYEPWFNKFNTFGIGEGSPLAGFYPSTDKNVLKLDMTWWSLMGITAIGIDWSNNC